eukprot:CAMPEP_0197725770 /NCGR_PEP_ID=MMETSP1434-20131217/10536_1 /TAXON_ID=265543 /ORGANISM="Minutocellus polymorphus, Strain CCMP3303" /LENGTH=315 /DNA_ID=CAMNT_0043311427 /DNA_START=19 /DNA_END=966 /DNA_ORIENTATION=-
MSQFDIDNSDDDSNGNGSRRSPRFTQWVAYLCASIVALVSSFQAIEAQGNADAKTKRETWAIVCTFLATVTTSLVVLAHMNSVASVLVVGTKLEAITVVILLALWSVTVAIVTDPSNGLAVGEDGEVLFGNLFYSAWAGWGLSVILATSCMRTIFGIDVRGNMTARAARLTEWAALFACSVVVMGGAANIYDADCTIDGRNAAWCKRTTLAVSLGTIGTLLSMMLVLMKIVSQAPFVLEVLASFLLFMSWAIGIGYITSELGPGAPIGNIYHFSWFSFLLTFVLGSSCYEDYQAAKTIVEESQLHSAVEEALSEF